MGEGGQRRALYGRPLLYAVVPQHYLTRVRAAQDQVRVESVKTTLACCTRLITMSEVLKVFIESDTRVSKPIILANPLIDTHFYL